MTMLIFSRRSLQQRLHYLESVLSLDDHKKLITRLNRPGRDRLAAMWETAFLAALHEETPLRYEIPLANGSRPDFSFTYLNGDAPIEIVGDITSISDKGIQENNPVGRFWNDIVRLAHKHGLNPNHFRYDIESRREGEYGDSRTVLLLPPRNQISAFMKQHIEPFICNLAKNPVPKAAFPYSTSDVAFTLSYDQTQMFAGGGHASYNIAYSKTKTPVYTALKRKADQLRHAPSQVLRIVILCDGGCYAMRKSTLPSHGSFSALQIATDFLASTRAIDLVLLVTVEKVNEYDMRDHRLRLRADLAAPPQGTQESRLSLSAIKSIHKMIEAMLQSMPTPMLDANNAALRCDARDYGLGFHGGYEMSSRKIRISSREVLELLAGKISANEFNQIHGWGQSSTTHQAVNPFLTALLRGEMIESLDVIDGGDHDDDWLEIHLGPPDPAISPFRRKG